MPAFEIGVFLPLVPHGPERTTPRWPEIRAMAPVVELVRAG